MIVMVLVSDGLRLASGGLAESSYRQLIYCRVPDDWIDSDIPETEDLWIKGPQLREDRLESLFETLYGATWRSGNSDGSQYEVLGTGMRLLNPTRVVERPWEGDDFSNESMRYFHYAVDTDGVFKRCLPSGL